MATKYVDPISGSNSNNGNSMASAYLTLAYAGASPQTVAGDTIIVKDGTYTGATANLLCSIPAGRIVTAQTVLGVKVNAGGGNGAANQGILYIPNSANATPTTVIGFEWYNFNYAGEYYCLINTKYTSTGQKTIIKNCCLHDVLWGTAGGARWFGLISGGSVFANTNQSWELDTCLFYKIDIANPTWFTGGNAPLFQGGSSATAFLNCKVTNCTIDITSSLALSQIIAFGATNTGNIDFKNTIIYRNAGAITFSNNNTLVNTLTAAATSNNMIYSAGGNGFSSIPSGMGNVSTNDPLFVDSTNVPPNYSLRPGSPAIDTGSLV